MNLFDPSFLFASLMWSSVGMAYFVYGKRQQSPAPLVAGILMVIASYFVGSVLGMSLICLGLMAAVYVLLRKGF